MMLNVLVVVFGLWAQQAKTCALIPRAEAAEILGKKEVATAKALFDDESDCNYRGAGFSLHIEEIPNQAQWSTGIKQLIQQKKAEALSGVGDEAVYTERLGDPEIEARKGTHWLTVTLYRNWGGPKDQVRPTLIKLAKAAVAKLH